ncbi:MAG: hypothetical protein DCC71_04250 [Proteobacteria bacterium]|nr:MAG: hypothetical protein DCC71_04250 [Pseudomonadota bacterium]
MGALRGALALGVLAAALALAPAARAELVKVEAIGSVPLGAASAGGATARQDALEAGIREAVERTAVGLAEQAGATASPDAVRAALGGQWKRYAVRYRILEDRGERAPLLETSPGAQSEYVVAVEVEVDQGRVRSQLASAGILAVAGSRGPSHSVRLALEGVDSYPLWLRIRSALAARGGAVRPLEFARARVLAEVETDEAPGAVMDRLGRALGEDYVLSPLGSDGDVLRVGVARVAPEAPAEPPLAPLGDPGAEAAGAAPGDGAPPR